MSAAVVAGRNLARLALPLWAFGMVIAGAALMVDHWVGLIVSPGDGRAVVSLAGAPAHRWTVAHVLYAACPCSRRVVTHLIERRPIDGVTEVVLVVGHLRAEPALRDAGFSVVNVDVDDLARLGIDAAPAFVVVDGDGAVRHAGGYTAHKQGLDYADVEAVDALRNGDVVTALPVLGCAMTRELQRALDPLLLKYRGVSTEEAR